MKERGYDVERISIDKFHNPNETRIRKGKLSPVGFFEDSFNLQKIIELVFLPVKENKGSITPGIYDYKTDLTARMNAIPIRDSLIVIFDGIFLNRDEFRYYWDLTIFLDISFATVLKRGIERDTKYFGPEQEVRKDTKTDIYPGTNLFG